MARPSRRGFGPRPRPPRPTLTLLNIGFLLFLLVAVILFKRSIGDRTAEFIGQFGTGEGTAEATTDEDPLTLAVEVAENLVHRAVDRAGNRR